jgi:glutamyl-tRNA synthetase
VKEIPNKKIVVRFPPSPTGFLHIGGARTALFNYPFAKQHGGTILLRFEDTDKERSKKEFEGDIKESLLWLGLKMDGEAVRQSERTDIYKKYLKQLVDSGSAYVSKEESTEGKRAEVIRFKNPNKKIVFDDLIRGTIEFDTTDLKDFVIAKSLEEPLYHLAVVIDDFEMGVTHVMRGEDHISNTPRQILIQEALGAPRPVYAHIPLILAPDRSKLSKRHGAVSVLEYRKLGYLPEALINYLALLGWNPGTEKEIFTLDELVKSFDLSKVQKGGAIFNTEKLGWINKEHLKHFPLTEIEKRLKAACPKLSEEMAQKLAPMTLERITRLQEIEEMTAAGELDAFIELPTYAIELLKWKEDPDLKTTGARLSETKKYLEKIKDEHFDRMTIRGALWDFATEKGRGSVLWPLRVALSGKEKSPDPFILAEILGKTETLKRIAQATARLA